VGELIVLLLAVGLGVATAKARASARSRLLELALAPFGLRTVRAGEVSEFLIPAPLFRLSSMTYEGRADGLRLIVQTQVRFVDREGNNLGNFLAREETARPQDQRVHFVRMVLDASPLIPKGFAMHLHFGHDFNVLGDEALATALLDGELRAVTGRGDELSIEDGRVVFESPFLVQRRPRRAVEALLRMIRRLSAVLSDRLALADLLLDNLERDDDPTVRANAVDTLFRFSRDPGARERAASIAMADHDPEVRFAAARHLGDRGFDVIQEIIGTELLHENVQQRALRYLARAFPDRAQPILTQALFSQSEQLQATAILLVAETCDRSFAAGALAKTEPASYFNATRLAEALGSVGGPQVEAALIELLYFRARRGQLLDLDMRIAVADALGRAGSLTAVRHLHPYAEGLLHDENLRLAAATAIELIQARAGGASGGGALSLVDPPQEAGKLSVADEERGLVSISSSAGGDVPMRTPARPPDDTG
jgi:hypothetical protein